MACSATGEGGSSSGGGGEASQGGNGGGSTSSAGTGSAEGGSGAHNASTSGAASGDAGVGGGIGPAFCPEAKPPIESGFDIGDQLANIVVKDCAGNDVSLDAFCGAESFWIFAAHGWCPLCQSVSGKQEEIVADYDGLIAINVLLEDGQGDTPTADYCELWRTTHGHDEVYTFFDPTGSIFALWPNGSTSLSAFVDRDRVIRSKLEHESDEARIRAEIEATLSE